MQKTAPFAVSMQRPDSRAVSRLRLYSTFHSFGFTKWPFRTAAIDAGEMTRWVISRYDAAK
jgi:hypothetical protein